MSIAGWRGAEKWGRHDSVSVLTWLFRQAAKYRPAAHLTSLLPFLVLICESVFVFTRLLYYGKQSNLPTAQGSKFGLRRGSMLEFRLPAV